MSNYGPTPASPFNYPGGKGRHADWILDHFPPHEGYVEPFGGSAAVLLAKKPAGVEVYNDVNGHLVHFFRVLRDQPAELADWLDGTPYSRQVHDQFQAQFYGDAEPSPEAMGDVERAGAFFYLQNSNYGGAVDASFKAPKVYDQGDFRNSADWYVGKRDAIQRFADRFQGVTLEQVDVVAPDDPDGDLFEKYDSPATLFYLDPPYGGTEYVYGKGGFDHAALAHRLKDLKGYFVLSYSDVPDGFQAVWGDGDGLWTASKESYASMNQQTQKDQTERLLMNFDPDEPAVGGWDQSSVQAGLADYAADGGQ